jgi:hypothetical protein
MKKVQPETLCEGFVENVKAAQPASKPMTLEQFKAWLASLR